MSSSKAVVAGDAAGQIGLARFNGDGTLDGAFGSGGTVTTDVPGGDADVRGLVVQADGQLVAAGQLIGAAGTDVLLARYAAAGAEDAAFGSGGVRIHDLGTSRDGALDAARDGSKVVVAGTVASGPELRFMAARFLT